jgi:hypothetical protein
VNDANRARWRLARALIGTRLLRLAALIWPSPFRFAFWVRQVHHHRALAATYR